MSWTLLSGVVFLLGLSLFAQISRRSELKRMRRSVKQRDRVVGQNGTIAQLQHPVIDLTRCLGCGTCIAACPEDGVLDLVHGQAMVVNGSNCKGIAACERECPVSAITITISNLETREDIPALTKDLEAVGTRGIFLAGEVTAHALVKTAIDQGIAVGAEVANRVRQAPPTEPGVLDLCIVGAGPAGLACSLEAKRQGLDFATLEQEPNLGGTVAKYPRRKLVMTQPVDLPLHGRLKKTTYSKEELMDLWQQIATKHELPIERSVIFKNLERDADGNFLIHTEGQTFRARNVCLALGRRGTPTTLSVPGEDLAKVAYSLMDAHSYQGRRILVVGGGDSAVEAALGLAEQPGNQVTLSYRGESFFRIMPKNQERLDASIANGKINCLVKSEVRAIHPGSVQIDLDTGSGIDSTNLPNDEVFVMIGGTPPFELLERSGVSFDSSLREPTTPLLEQGTGLTKALMVGFALALAVLAWALLHADYYLLPGADRPAHPKHAMLRPGLGIGLWLGVAASLLIIANLLYLLRRAPWARFKIGSLQVWMTSHVITGILAFLLAMLHSAMAPQDTPGGHAFWALAVLLLTGAIGRYFYAYIPRAANGRELELAEVKARLSQFSDRWEHGQRKFREHVRDELSALIENQQWRASFAGRLLSLFGVQRHLHQTMARLSEEGRRTGISDQQIAETMELARSTHRTALMAAHYEDLRAILNTWRYLHRWVAALMVLLIGLHVFNALVHGNVVFDRGPG